ncbi:transposase [Pandoraea sputorum]|nr:transposase [Pandoraea sputorum]
MSATVVYVSNILPSFLFGARVAQSYARAPLQDFSRVAHFLGRLPVAEANRAPCGPRERAVAANSCGNHTVTVWARILRAALRWIPERGRRRRWHAPHQRVSLAAGAGLGPPRGPRLLVRSLPDSLYGWTMKLEKPVVVQQGELNQNAEFRPLKAELKRVTEERDMLKMYWSTPDWQVAGFPLRQNNVCVNVFGLFAQCVTAGHDGICAHQKAIKRSVIEDWFFSQALGMPVNGSVSSVNRGSQNGTSALICAQATTVASENGRYWSGQSFIDTHEPFSA